MTLSLSLCPFSLCNLTPKLPTFQLFTKKPETLKPAKLEHTTSTTTAASVPEQCQFRFLGKGSKVEVWCEEDDFKNAWFSAEILRPPSHSPSSSGRKKTATVVVKYDHMLSSSEDGEPLVESVEARFIRPVPPPDSQTDRPFELNEVVDAFFHDIWWTGFVVKVVNDTYTVAFKSPPDLQEFRRSDMRPHWEWVDSKWVRPDKEDTTGLIYIPGTEVEINLHDEVPCCAWFPAVVIGQVESTSFLVKYKSPESDGEEDFVQVTVDLEQIRPHPPEMEDKNFDVLEKVDVFHNSCWWVGLITKILVGKGYIITLRRKKEMEFSHSELRPHLEWINGQWISKSKGVVFTSDCQEHTRPTLHESLGSKLEDTEKERPCSSDKQDSRKELSPCVKKSPNFISSNMEKENRISNGDQPVVVIPNVKKTKQQDVREMENQAVVTGKKRGRPRKSHESSCSTLCDTEKERGSSDRQDNQKDLSPRIGKSPDFGSWNMEKEDHISSGYKPVEVIPNDKKTKQQEVGDVEPKKHRKDDPSKSNSEDLQPSSRVEGTSQKMVDTNNSELMTEDLEVGEELWDFEGVKELQVENSCQSPMENEQKGAPETGSEIKGNGEQPELALANTHAAAAGEGLSGAAGGVAACTTETSESPVRSEVISIGNAASTNVQNLPFVKSYPIWQMIESMEVFKKFPQDPNFQPLMKRKEVKRESAAIGHMMNFAAVIEKISKLQENHSREDFESIMEELDELEGLGFDIKVVRGRVSELLRVKLLLQKLIAESNGVGTEIQECSDAKIKIDGEVADIDKELKRLEQKRAMLMSESMDKDSKVFKLISGARVINDCISSARESFRSLVETFW